MLTREVNERIVRVGQGTPMGAVLRAYWLPAVLSEEVESDGSPLRVRLLGEDLVAFRDSSGKDLFTPPAAGTMPPGATGRAATGQTRTAPATLGGRTRRTGTGR